MRRVIKVFEKNKDILYIYEPNTNVVVAIALKRSHMLHFMHETGDN
jgi:hypothetical protein